jgi:hypothetical protein
MAKQILNNGETGAVIRSKINSNFTEVYSQIVPSEGTAGQVLTKQTSGYNWADPADSGGPVGVLPGDVATVTFAQSPYLITTAYETINVNALSGSVTVVLPTAVGNKGRVFHIRKSDTSANTVVINPAATQTINDNTTIIISYRHTAVTVQSDGANWIII